MPMDPGVARTQANNWAAYYAQENANLKKLADQAEYDRQLNINAGHPEQALPRGTLYQASTNPDDWYNAIQGDWAGTGSNTFDPVRSLYTPSGDSGSLWTAQKSTAAPAPAPQQPSAANPAPQPPAAPPSAAQQYYQAPQRGQSASPGGVPRPAPAPSAAAQAPPVMRGVSFTGFGRGQSGAPTTPATPSASAPSASAPSSTGTGVGTATPVANMASSADLNSGQRGQNSWRGGGPTASQPRAPGNALNNDPYTDPSQFGGGSRGRGRWGG